MPPAFLVSRAKLPHGVSYVAPLLPALSLPRAPRLQASSSRKIVHMHGIGGDGEYCGDNDAQFDRINVFYHEASGGKYVPRRVLFEPGMIGAVRASPLGELFRKILGCACGLVMGSNSCSVLKKSPLIANGAKISRIGGFIKTAKIERKVQALR